MARGMQLKHDVEWGLEKSESRKVTRKKKGKTTMDSGYTAHKTGRLDKQWLRDKDNVWPVATRTKTNQDRCGNAIPRVGETGARRQEVRQHTGTQVVPKGNSEGSGRNGWSTFKGQRKRRKKGNDGSTGFEALGWTR